jgi:transcriptional regulator with XRE-family HTH domain
MKAGFTFRQLSKLSGLSATLLFNLESGNHDPKLSSIENLASAFGESVTKFLRGFYSRQR